MIELDRFIEFFRVDPHYFERTLLLIPDNSEKPYALIRKVLEKTGLAAIGKVTMSTKERVVLIHYYQNAIVATTLRCPDEVTDEGRGCAGAGEEAKKAGGHEHDGGADSYDEILEFAQNLLNISNVYIARSCLSTRYFRIQEGNIMTEKAARNFALRDAKGNEDGVFTGKSPRQAALKAANRGVKDIRLRERGTKKVHIFTGERKQVKKPANAPAWMPAKIWKPKVKKVGVEKLEVL